MNPLPVGDRHRGAPRYGWQAALLDLVSRLSGRIRRRVWLAVSLR